MATEDWILQALERIDDVGMGDDPLDGLNDEQVRHLEAAGLIRVEYAETRVSELGNDKPLVHAERKVSITLAGRRLIDGA